MYSAEMAFIPSGFGQISARHTHPSLGRSAFVVYGFQNSGVNATDPVALADEHWDIWTTAFGDNIDSSVDVGPFECTVNLGGGPVSATGTETAPGSFSGNAVAPNSACLIRKSSSSPGRGGRGRMYMPWYLPDDAVDEIGRVDPTSRAGRQADAEAWLAALAASDNNLVILHAVSGDAPAEVTGLSVDNIVGSQRRRLGR